MTVTDHDPHVEERLAATRARWEREVQEAESKLAFARMDERLAGQKILEIELDSDEWDRAAAAHLRAADRRASAQDALARISSEYELNRRLEKSAQLARRFR